MDGIRVIVLAPSAGGGRGVRIGSEVLGVAHSPADLVEFLRRAGHPDPDAVLLAGPREIEWRGGGPDVWPAPGDG